MMNTNLAQDDQAFLQSIQNETKIFNNIGFIIEKMEAEGNFKTVKETFTNLFGREVLYTVKGHLTRAAENPPVVSAPQHLQSADKQHLHIQRKPQDHSLQNKWINQSTKSGPITSIPTTSTPPSARPSPRLTLPPLRYVSFSALPHSLVEHFFTLRGRRITLFSRPFRSLRTQILLWPSRFLSS